MTTASRNDPAGRRGLVVPTVVVAGLSVALAAATRGSPGLLGALVGAGLVLASFSVSHLVLERTAYLPPELTLLIALGLYTVKVVALALTFVLLSGFDLLGDPLHRGALGLSVIACTLTWTVAEVRHAMTVRIPTYDLGGKSS